MHDLAVYVKEGLPFNRDLSKKTLLILTYVFDWLYFTLCLASSSSTDHLFHLDPQFNSISSNIDKVLSINSSANVFVSGDFNVYHKD